MNHDHVTCRDCIDLLFDYLESNLDSDTLKQLDEHFSACPPCVNFLKTYRSCSEMGKRLQDQNVQIPVALEVRLQEFIKKELKT